MKPKCFGRGRYIKSYFNVNIFSLKIRSFMLKCTHKLINNTITVIKSYEAIIDLFKRRIKSIKTESVMPHVPLPQKMCMKLSDHCSGQ